MAIKYKQKSTNGSPAAYPELNGATQKMSQVHSLGVGSFLKTGTAYRILSLDFLLQAQIIHSINAIQTISDLSPMVLMDALASKQAGRAKNMQALDGLNLQLVSLGEYHKTHRQALSKVLRDKNGSPDFVTDSVRLKNVLDTCLNALSTGRDDLSLLLMPLVELSELLPVLMGKWVLSTPVIFRVIDLLGQALKELGHDVKSQNNPAGEAVTTAEPTITA